MFATATSRVLSSTGRPRTLAAPSVRKTRSARGSTPVGHAASPLWERSASCWDRAPTAPRCTNGPTAGRLATRGHRRSRSSFLEMPPCPRQPSAETDTRTREQVLEARSLYRLRLPLAARPMPENCHEPYDDQRSRHGLMQAINDNHGQRDEDEVNPLLNRPPAQLHHGGENQSDRRCGHPF